MFEKSQMKLITIAIFMINISIVNAMPEIHFHAKDGRVNKVKQLLDNDPNLVKSTTKWGDTPLHWAIRAGRKPVVDVLLEYGANITAVNNFGNTCLHVAAEYNHPELVELMLRNGVDIQAKNKDGETPLHVAALGCNNEAIRTLIESGADTNAKNNYGHTPLDKAISSKKLFETALSKDNAGDDFKKGITCYDAAIRILSSSQENNSTEIPEVINSNTLDNKLALTPPMGWNSWNAFETDINEEKIKQIADAMVDSGMRDAGYIYLVLDDGWMADTRDLNGNLMADPNKFPSGMKAIGDYIHSKGLKFGLYEDRGHLTCQQLPGSFEHERADINTFASWGVDYIKIDSCFAENNGRLSSEDYTLYRYCIISTGRPMVLSISDFGNGAWTWGAEKMAQLWRTSYDIYPWMDSVYYCADTSAGDLSIHPAFNGLWQFAGPGHFNDPDMLQVGNMKETIENKAHFSLWCTLAAPLMAGNDIKSMSDTVKEILTAPEVIKVNQDPRGIQGYKVYDNGNHEIYNKPLQDGTTAVLLLNKGEETADITVTWDKIRLSGSQKVRDLWAQKDLGYFTDSFTAGNLSQHGVMLIKVGSPGPPLPAPAPVPLDKYTVTKIGVTYLSDLYYIFKNGNHPKKDRNYIDNKITINGAIYNKGLGCKDDTKIMYKLNNEADSFNAFVGLDDSYDGNGTGRFRIYNEDLFGNRVLFDSGDMNKGTIAKRIKLDVKGIMCLLLVFEGENVLGNWADAKAVADN
ncbi:MAG: ankyrin repeat domain-containing protein [Planctomycetota bacterium]